jgi:hypothetical protein
MSALKNGIGMPFLRKVSSIRSEDHAKPINSSEKAAKLKLRSSRKGGVAW